MEWEKISTNQLSDKRLISKKYTGSSYNSVTKTIQSDSFLTQYSMLMGLFVIITF